MTKDPMLKDLINKQFPQVFREDAELLVKFIEYYYEWLQKEGNPLDVIRKINYYRDVDKVPDKFYSFLRGEFMKNLPQGMAVDETILYKNILDFYRSKGSEKSFRLLFKILYNEDISFYYPADDILRGSDGHWVIERSIRITPNMHQDDFKDFYLIDGETSGAKARFEKIVSSIVEDHEVFDLYVSHVDGEFIKGERIIAYGLEGFIGIVESDGVVEHEGRYDGTYGFLSSDKYLQDNHYYQEYSYVINSTKTVDQYQKIVKDTVHPAGLKLFGAIELESIIEAEKWYMEAGMHVDLTIRLERVIDYDWSAQFDYYSSFGVISREAIIDYWGDKKFTNTAYVAHIENVSFNENTYSYYNDSRNTIRHYDFNNHDINIGDYVAFYENINSAYHYEVYGREGRTRILVKPRLAEYESDSAIRIFRNNTDEVAHTEVQAKLKDDKFIKVGTPLYDNINEILDEPIVNLYNININEFKSGRLFRSEYEQVGVLADQRVYTVREYSKDIQEKILANENDIPITNEDDLALLLDTYGVDKKHKIVIKQLSKKYSIFNDNVEVIDYDYSNDKDFESDDIEHFVAINSKEAILCDENGIPFADHTDFLYATFY